MRLRFTIRDLLWLTLVVALCTACQRTMTLSTMKEKPPRPTDRLR
jgi:hypothetical protein